MNCKRRSSHIFFDYSITLEPEYSLVLPAQLEEVAEKLRQGRVALEHSMSEHSMDWEVVTRLKGQLDLVQPG